MQDFKVHVVEGRSDCDESRSRPVYASQPYLTGAGFEHMRWHLLLENDFGRLVSVVAGDCSPCHGRDCGTAGCSEAPQLTTPRIPEPRTQAPTSVPGDSTMRLT
jgi:hypothetical protein